MVSANIRQAQLYDCITTILDISAAMPVIPLPSSRQTTAHPLPRAKVLVVEDNVVNQKLAVRLLEKDGCCVDVAANGLEAVEASARIAYACIFMDCQMPEMDGFAATAAIRQHEAQAETHIPIIAMTANAMYGDRERCLHTGMDDYIPKPVQAEEL